MAELALRIRKYFFSAFKKIKKILYVYKPNRTCRLDNIKLKSNKNIVIMKVTKQADQSILDILLQASGMLNGAIDLLRENGISITQQSPDGICINVPGEIERDDAIVNYYSINNTKPATNVDVKALYYENGIEGIGEELLEQIIPDTTSPNKPNIHFGSINNGLAKFLVALNGGDDIDTSHRLKYRIYSDYDAYTEPLFETGDAFNDNNVTLEGLRVKLENVDVNIIDDENKTITERLFRISVIDVAGNESEKSEVYFVTDENFSLT